MAKTLILLANLGTPDAPDVKSIRRFLKSFLGDRRVVEVPRPLWFVILNAFILPFRPKSIAENYQMLWDEYGDSPLRLITQSQVSKLSEAFASEDIVVDYCFTYGEPSLSSQLSAYRNEVERTILLPLYPQYSCSTTAAIYDQ